MNVQDQGNLSIVDIFDKIALSQGNNCAVAFKQGEKWHRETFAQLYTKANQVAHTLSHAGLQPGQAVILPATRHPDICAYIIGVLKAGGHYVFMDAGYPLPRKKLIAEACDANLGLLHPSLEDIDGLDIRWLTPDFTDGSAPDGWKPATDARSHTGQTPAYVVFTSGSTGQPKGVLIPDRAIIRLVKNTDYISFSSDQVFLQHSSLSFDASTLEIWGPLLNGGTCVIHPETAHITPEAIGHSIEEQNVTTLWLTSSFYNAFISSHADCLKNVKQLLVGGEALSVTHIRKGLETLPNTRLFNGYGPTENTTFTTVYPIPRTLPADCSRIPIGFPIEGTNCDLFDEDLKPVPGDNPTGELVAFGEGLALGYLNNDALTREKFVEITCRDGVTRRGYRTGDLVIYHPDGYYDYLQRADKQVKIDGHRIEPGEIELLLNQQPEINEARVLVRTGPQGQKRLTAYYGAEHTVPAAQLRSRLEQTLPRFMVPHFFVGLRELPHNKNGKLDEHALPDPFDMARGATNQGGISADVASCWRDVLGREVGDSINFLDAGGTSLEAVRLTERLAKQFGTELPATFVFEFSSIAAQSRYFAGQQPADNTTPAGESFTSTGQPHTGFAVVGMACRLPGADSAEAFWNNLLAGKESVSFFRDEELSPEIPPQVRQNPNYVKAKGIVADCDAFDNGFFNVPPVEAELMDPQQRLLLELAWHAFEDANCVPGNTPYRTGVFAGTNWPRYFQQYVLPNKPLLDRVGQFNASLANEADFVSSRIAYKLDLNGPAVNVFTACSTGLVAIAQACAAIEQGQCELALAGGASIATPVNSGYLYQEGGMLSADGHCRPFDSKASGTTFNDGAAMVLLKRLDLAERDGDRIYGVIKGYAINNDGSHKASFTAPSIEGQTRVYQTALNQAGIQPSAIGFIETHGTATPLGDPIEVEALGRVYGTQPTGDATGNTKAAPCYLGSVKSNIGHTIHAAGVAGFIKTILSVQQGKIPGTLFFESPNPRLNLHQSRFQVNSETRDWPTSNERIAAVSSLGVGGTNAHIIVAAHEGNTARGADQASSNTDTGTDTNTDPVYPLLLSAKSEDALNRMVQDYSQALEQLPEPRQASQVQARDISFTAIRGRQCFDYKLMVSGRTPGDFSRRLNSKRHQVKAGNPKGGAAKTGLLFSGQGSQSYQMGALLYQHNKAFRESFDAGCEIIKASEGFDLRSILLGTDHQDIGLDIHQTKVAQPALFLLEYGLGSYLGAHGVEPDFMIGHSIGEFAAATLAGVFSFEDAVSAVARRGSLMQSMPPGAMLVVKAERDTVTQLIQDYAGSHSTGHTDKGISLAAVNGPAICVVAGPTEAIDELEPQLAAGNIKCRRLQTSHAFHSPMMDPILPEFRNMMAGLSLGEPGIPIYSTHTGQLLTAEQAQSPDYWANQLRQPVYFSEALTQAITQTTAENAHAAVVLLEAGPGNSLATLASMHSDLAIDAAIAMLPDSGATDDTPCHLTNALGALWARGIAVDWEPYFAGDTPEKIRLPGYPFQRTRHWVSVTDTAPDTATGAVTPKIMDIPASTTEIIQPQEVIMSSQQHADSLKQKVISLFEDITGYDLADMDTEAHFSESGLDSLLLTQIATALEAEYQVGLTFRHLVEDLSSLDTLLEFLGDKVAPAAEPAPAPATQGPAPIQGSNPMPVSNTPLPTMSLPAGASDSVQALINAQLQIMQMQLQALTGSSQTGADQLPAQSTQPAQAAQAQPAAPAAGNTPAASPEADKPAKPRHTPGTRISKEKLGIKLTQAQQDWLQDSMNQYAQKFAGSKAYTQKHRRQLADPRSVSGFHPEWKEIIFPIVTNRSKGSKLWDIDGNELIDLSNGFGPILFGHSPDFVTEAVKQQMDEGIETGPQSPLAGEVAELFCELTGNERCAFASTGSEAVIGAIRLARTVTGRQKIVMFEGSYHGIFDEVINRPGRDYQALPAAPGIPREMTSNMLVLPWGDPDTLETLRSLGKDVAGVLVETVQSRKPEYHDQAFIKGLREVTESNGSALIFDEVVTGFRVHPGGIRKLFDVDCDIATYGKVLGGGYPIGMIGGKAKFLDALDGGHWQYGDESIPECGVTFFAGTFVRHPVALAAAKAILTQIKQQGDSLYKELANNTTELAAKAKAFIADMKCGATFEEFASLFYVSVPASAHWGHMLFTLMTLRGIHIQQYRPCFLTTCHDSQDREKILNAFKDSLAEMISHGLIEGDAVAAGKHLKSGAGKIPEGARLGRNAQGEPAYFIEDPDNKGNYIEVGRP